MTDEERQLIQTLADHVKSAPAAQVDRDADTLIRQTIGARPDALYILTQTVLIQEMALNQAKQQIEQLKQQAPAQPPANFLPNNPAPQQSSGYRSGGYQGSSYRSDYAPPPPPPPPPPQVQYIQDPQPSGGRFSGFLHNAAQTAAGVVAGEVAFSALSSIFGGHGGGGGGFFGGGGYGVSPGSETIINNYYDDDRGRGGGGGGFGGNDRSLSDSGLSPDLEDRRFAGSDSGDDQQSDDQQDDLQQDDSDVSDDNTDDNSDDSSDDGSSYDDGSGSDDV